MYTRKCRCVFTSLPPSCLIYCICAPSHVYFSYAFSPHVFGLPFSSRRHISRISYFSYSFAVDIFLGPAYLGWVLFDVQPGPGRHPDLFSDASTLTNRPQICCFKSEIYHQCFNIGWNILFSRDRESEGQPVPNQRLREGASHPTRGQRTASHSFWKSLCTCKRTSRCEYIHLIIVTKNLYYQAMPSLISSFS